MQKLFLSLISELAMKKIKMWLAENGFMGVTALAVAAGAMFFGMWFVFWGALGFFCGKNWEIIKNLWQNKYKEKVEDIVENVKEKI